MSKNTVNILPSILYTTDGEKVELSVASDLQHEDPDSTTAENLLNKLGKCTCKGSVCNCHMVDQEEQQN